MNSSELDAVGKIRRVAVDLLLEAGDETGAWVLQRLGISHPWEAVEQEEVDGRALGVFNVVRQASDNPVTYEHAPGPPFEQSDAEALVAFLNERTHG